MRWCGDGVSLPMESERARASRHCTLPGFTVPWTEAAPRDRITLGIWQGAPPDLDSRQPREPESEGCPGGWARCGFASSFAKYIRPRIQGGAHDANPLVHAGTPAHILEALRRFETHQARAETEFRRVAGF